MLASVVRWSSLGHDQGQNAVARTNLEYIAEICVCRMQIGTLPFRNFSWRTDADDPLNKKFTPLSLADARLAHRTQFARSPAKRSTARSQIGGCLHLLAANLAGGAHLP